MSRYAGSACAGLMLMLAAVPAEARVTRVTPVEPRWGDVLTVIYDSRQPGAILTAMDEVHVVVDVASYDGRRRWSLPMTSDGERFRTEVTLVERDAYAQLFFVTRGSTDQAAQLSVIVRRSDGVEARGAYMRQVDYMGRFDCEDGRCGYDDLYDKELQRYPESYAVYPLRWMKDQSIKRAEFKEIVQQGSKRLPEKRPDEPPDLLYARMAAALYLDRAPSAYEIMLDLVREYPRSRFTPMAWMDVKKDSYTRDKIPAIAGDLDNAVRDAVLAHPDSPLARQAVEFSYSWDPEVPIDLIEKVVRAWMDDRPGSHKPALSLARAYARRDIYGAAARTAVDRALERMLSGEARLAGDVNAGYLKWDLPRAYQYLGAFQIADGDYAGALATAMAVKAMSAESDLSGPLMEGRVWQETGHWKRAETSFATIVDRDASGEARSHLEQIYRARHGGLDAFDEHLDSLVAESSTTRDEEVLELPAAVVETLGGKTIDTTELIGKVVVLNFWSLGCVPCLMEVPDLNELVAAFEGNDEVVFLAPAGDGAKNIKSFLKDHPFSYEVIPAEGKLTRHFGVESLPTHVIIDREGKTAFRMSGALGSRSERFRKRIEDLLKPANS